MVHEQFSDFCTTNVREMCIQLHTIKILKCGYHFPQWFSLTHHYSNIQFFTATECIRIHAYWPVAHNMKTNLERPTIWCIITRPPTEVPITCFRLSIRQSIWACDSTTESRIKFTVLEVTRSLITKTTYLNGHDFLIRILYKYCYWLILCV